MTMEIVYNCMLSGITDREHIVKKTGMSRQQVQSALSSLYRQEQAIHLHDRAETKYF